jgi:5-methylcytosine-specific restriction endonuclease McrA
MTKKEEAKIRAKIAELSKSIAQNEVYRRTLKKKKERVEVWDRIQRAIVKRDRFLSQLENSN